MITRSGHQAGAAHDAATHLIIQTSGILTTLHHGSFSGGAAHIKGDDVRQIQFLGQGLGPHDTARWPGFYDIGRFTFGYLGTNKAAVGLHQQ